MIASRVFYFLPYWLDSCLFHTQLESQNLVLTKALQPKRQKLDDVSAGIEAQKNAVQAALGLVDSSNTNS